MFRECIKLNVPDILGSYQSFAAKSVELYIDAKNKTEILNYLKKQTKKTRRILYTIYSLQYMNDLYGKEEVSDKAKGITAMKFKNTRASGNGRIYCKEYPVSSDGSEKKVVLIALYLKRDMDRKTKKFIENLGRYDYEF